MRRLDALLAARWAELALANIATEYPYKLDQLLGCDADTVPPHRIHPAFWGSYDWHSCVHMHWTLARLLRRFPDHAQAIATERHLAARLTQHAIGGELLSLDRPGHASFERPYGWGWLLMLAAELNALAHDRPAVAQAAEAVALLASMLADRFVAYLPRADYATRTGVHGNTAFALILALEYAERLQHRALRKAIVDRANHWFGRDRRYPADYEPGGEDFLSPGLVEAVLMQETVDSCSFDDWWTQFAPTPSALVTWLTPVEVSDARDPKIVHLHGLNLSRAWCWRRLLPDLPVDLSEPVSRAIDAHLAASLQTASDGDYVGTHWLASFALLAVDDA